MLRVAILYYSATGTTKLVCEAIKARLSETSVDLIDMKKTEPGDVSGYDMIGFAFFADLMRPSPKFIDYVSQIEGTQGKPAFLINTYGSTGGRSPHIAYQILHDKGITVFASHSLHTPESYPPLIHAGFGFANHPTNRDLKRFWTFADCLKDAVRRAQHGETLSSKKPRLDLVATLAPKSLDGLFPKQFGPKPVSINDAGCVRCGLCVTLCPGKAITLSGVPRVDPSSCQQCWACYNHCPKKAVRIGKMAGEAQYKGPSEELKAKLLLPEASR